MKKPQILITTLLSAVVILFGGMETSHAATFSVTTSVGSAEFTAYTFTVNYSVSLNKSTYNAYEDIVASAIFIDGMCSNGQTLNSKASAVNNLDGRTAYVVTGPYTSNTGVAGIAGPGTSGSAIFNAGSGATTNSSVTFSAEIYDNAIYGYTPWGGGVLGSIPYTVTAAAGKCSTPLPMNAAPHNPDGQNDTSGLPPGDTTKSYAGSNTGAKCEFYCANGSVWNPGTQQCQLSGSCGAILNTCTAGTLNDTPDALAPNGTVDTHNWQCVGSGGGASPACTYNASNCEGSLPANAVPWNGDGLNDSAGLSADTAKVYRESDTAAKCEFTCNAGYSWNSGAGKCDPILAANCTGSLPANTVLHPGDDSVAVDTAKQYSAVDNAGTQCEYACQPGYSWNSGGKTCDVIPNNGVCGTAADTCSFGTWSDAADTATHYQWQCLGGNGASNADDVSCSAAKPVGSFCGPAQGRSFAVAPSAGDLCSAGSWWFQDNSGADGSFNWTCTNAGVTQACTATNSTYVPPPPEDHVSGNAGSPVYIHLPQTTAQPSNPSASGGHGWMKYTWSVPQTVCTSSGPPLDPFFGWPTCYTWGPAHAGTISDPTILKPIFGNMTNLGTYRYNFEARAPYSWYTENTTANNGNSSLFMEVRVRNRDLVGKNLQVMTAGPYLEAKPVAIRARTAFITSGLQEVGKVITSEFTYRWDNVGPWLSFANNTQTHNSMTGPATTTYKYATITPDRSGNLYLQYCADSLNVVAEFGSGLVPLESNNCIQSGPYAVGANASLPNLVPLDLQTPAAVSAGDQIAFSAYVQNQGAAATPSGFTNNFTYQWNGTGGAWQNFPAFFGEAALGAGASASRDSFSFATTTIGILFIQYCADSTNVIIEGAAGEVGNCVVSTGTTVNPAAGPNLVSESFNPPAGATQGNPIALSATVRNIGTAAAGAFSDDFTYQWGGTGGGWTNISNEPHATGLAAGDSANDVDSYTPNASGNLFLQHCVDTPGSGSIPEGANETPNCTIRGPITVVALANVPTLTAGSCFIDVGASSCVTQVTWSSSGLTSPSIREDAIQFSTSEDSTDVPRTIPYGTHTYTIYDGAAKLTPPGDVTVNAACRFGDVWNAGTVRCESNIVAAAPTLSSNPRIVDVGDTIDLTWSADPGIFTTCNITGGQLGTTYSPIPTDSGTVYDIPIYANTTFTINCPGVGSKSVTVEVQPKGTET